ncbi:aldose 1-epimerase family protein [Jiangella alkaliphila]|uniref:Aldose 1-epimerase n=1 Tax=Jiangella alkaliphila TaxID=419479 RepID=A0A1H2K3T4_9ACTN|nr:aldose 1-epimerase family protein [Jiangella alkaliphila]SDU63058.1 aldose 1-epimerase [Jiangella alkaliphila]
MDTTSGTAQRTTHALELGTTRAVVSEYAAALRSLTVAGTELIEPHTADGPPPLAAGAVLVPWPNRVDGGRWTHDGVEQRLEVTEPAAGHAVHGLLLRTRYARGSSTAASVTLAAPVTPQPGHPFTLDTSVEYELTPDGVVVRHRLRNAGAGPAPVALGIHPYLRVGDVPARDLTLTVPGRRAFRIDERNIPTGTYDLTGTGDDLRAGVRVGDGPQHACFTDLDVTGGVVTSSLRAPDGRVVELWQEPAFGYVQMWVTDYFPGPGGPADAVAVEPMTAPPNALRTGEALRWLLPDETWTLTWGLRLVQG